MNRRSFIQSLLAVAVAPVFSNVVSLIVPTEHVETRWQVSTDPDFNDVLFDTEWNSPNADVVGDIDKLAGLCLKSATYRHQVSVGRGFKKIIHDGKFTLGSNHNER